jgi:polysaccharide biosynthesis transport protein
MNDRFPLDRPRPETALTEEHHAPRHANPGLGEQRAFGEDVLDLHTLLQTLRRNAGLIAAIALLATAAAAWAAYRVPDRYRATSALRILDERRMLTGGMDVGLAEGMLGRQTDPILSQMQVLRSRSVLGEVADRVGMRLAVVEGGLSRSVLGGLSITSDATADTLRVTFTNDSYTVSGRQGPTTAAYGVPVEVEGVSFTISAPPADREPTVLALRERDRAIDGLMERLRTRPRERTDVVDLEFEARDPVIAQQVVNTTAQVFRERSQQAAGEQSRRRREFVEARLLETEAVLREAQDALSDFQRREQVFSSQDLFAAQQVSIHNLDMRIEELRSERRMFVALRDGLSAGATQGEGIRTMVSAPGLEQNPVVSQLYRQLVNYEIRQDSLRASGSSATNPDWVRNSALIASTEQNLTAALSSHINALDARISAAEEVRGRRSAELTAMPGRQAEESRLVIELETIRRMADQLREEAQRARISEVVEAGQVDIVDLAPLPSAPVNDRKPLKLALGMMLGLMMGSGAALLRETMNTAVRSREDVEEQLRVPSLAVVPQIRPIGPVSRVSRILGNGRKKTSTALVRSGTNGAAGVDPSLIVIHNPQSAAAEAYRTLRTNLIFSQADRPIRTLVVTSSSAGEGKTTTAANLAASYAQQGMSVLLVDADLRRPQQHHLFGIGREPGLTDLVLERASVDDVIRRTSLAGLCVVPSGMQPPNPAELVGGPRFRAAMAKLAEGFDLVIVDTPPVLAASEGAIMGARADAVVMVVRAGTTDRDSARQAMLQLRTVSANVVGVLLNDVEGNVPKYSRYQYYYTYYGADETVRA